MKSDFAVDGFRAFKTSVNRTLRRRVAQPCYIPELYNGLYSRCSDYCY